MKYLKVDNLYVKPMELPLDGLVADIHVENGVVVDSINTTTDFSSYTVDGDYFLGSANQYESTLSNALPDNISLSSYSMVWIAKLTDLKQEVAQFFNMNNDKVYPLQRWVNDYNHHGLYDGNRLTNSESYLVYDNTDLNGRENNTIRILPRLVTGIDADSNNIDEVLYIVSYDSENKETKSKVNESKIFKIINEADVEPLTRIRFCNNYAFMKHFLLYNRALSDEEYEQIIKTFKFSNDSYYNSCTYVQGMTGLGSSSAFQAKSNELPEQVGTPTGSGEQTFIINGETKTFTNIDFQNPICNDSMSKFTAVYFTNPIESLTVGEIYNLEAFPYPYKINDEEYLYNIEYTTSDASVLECYNGVLIPKASGTAIITAKIANADISNTISITIMEAEPEDTSNYCYLPKKYSSGINSLLSANPTQVLKAIRDAIYDAKKDGYNGIIFPKLNYKVRPFKSVDEDGNQIPIIIVPSDFTVDFNGSSFYVQDNDQCVMADDTCYTMFSFGTSNIDSGNTVENECSNSIVKNLNYYGERYVNGDKYAEDYYHTSVYSFSFPWVGGKKNRIENIRFDGTIGYNISFSQNGFRMWSGTSEDGAVRGCMKYDDFIVGKWSADGSILEVDETGAWYSTSDFMKLGYTYSDHITDYRHMKYYKLGQMGYATRQGSSGWWYETWWYDENKKLIEHNEHQMSLESYLLPKDAVYFKCAVMFWDAPTGNSATDTPHVVRFWPSLDPDQCYIDNCKFINPHAMAIAFCGGTNCVIKNCYAQQGASFSNSTGTYGWSIDFEDGWLAMRHNTAYNLLCSGLIPNPGGYNTAYINCCINSLTSKGSANEALKIINSTIGNINCSYKTNDVYNNVTYGNMTTNISSDLSIASVRKVNCIQNTDLKLF